MNKKIDTVVFDIGMVMMGWYTSLEGFFETEEMGKTVWKSIFAYGDWEELDRGVIPEAELFDRMVSHAPQYEEQIRRILADMRPFCVPHAYATPWVQELKAMGYKVYYLSNFSDHLRKQVPDYLSFIDDMDGGVFSYEERLAKPDPEIYKVLLNRYHLVPEHCLFIDDRQENIDAAIACGINGFHFANYEESYEPIMQLLRDNR